MMTWDIRQGDALTLLKAMPPNSIHCIVTSPPYWGLRDYRVAGQLGLEKTPEEYVAKMVEVFREVKRVLRKDGTLWLNLGDSYTSGGRGSYPTSDQIQYGKQSTHRAWNDGDMSTGTPRPPIPIGLKPKDLCGIPWRVAFALQADGWWLRSDIVWHKLNPMPESVTDRPTKAHEYVFLLTKSAQYFYDAEAIKEPSLYPTDDRGARATEEHKRFPTAEVNGIRASGVYPMRNIRTVWTIPTQPFPEAHFATFPEKLVEPCIRAGTSERGCCAVCGAPWERIVQKLGGTTGRAWHDHCDDLGRGQRSNPAMSDGSYRVETIGWHPTCQCDQQITPCSEEDEKCRASIGGSQDDLKAHNATHSFGYGGNGIVPCTIFDPFCGSGTVGVVALKLQRNFLGVELSPSYVEIARRRMGDVRPLFEQQDSIQVSSSLTEESERRETR